MTWALIAKDLRQHRRSILILTAAAFFVSFFDRVLVNAKELNQFLQHFRFSYVTILTPMELAMWFVGQEKVKETIRILRLLPVSPGKLMGAKMLGIALVSEMFYVGSALVVMASSFIQTHTLEPPGWEFWVMLPVPLLVASVLTPVYIRFHYKIAGLVMMAIYVFSLMSGSVVVSAIPVAAKATVSSTGTTAPSAEGALIMGIILWGITALVALAGWFLSKHFYGRTEEVSQLIDD